MPSLLELAGYVQQQGDIGRQRGMASRLGQLASQAYTAPRGDRDQLLGQMASVSPEAAASQQKAFRQNDSDRMADLSRKARLFVGMAESGNQQAVAALYPQIAQEARNLGLGDIPLEYNESFLPGLKQFASILDASPNKEALAPRVVGDALVDPTGKVLYQSPAQQDYQWSERAGAWIPKPMSRSTHAEPMSGTDASGQPYRLDPNLTPEQREAAMADIAASGGASSYQLAPKVQSGLTAIPVAGITPKREESYSTLSPEEVQAAGLPVGTVAQRSPAGQIQIVNKPRDLPTGGQIIDNGDGTTTYIPAGKVTEGERNAAGFYQRMVAASKELGALEAAGYDPTNIRDFLTTGRTATNFAASPEGQQYYQAAMNWVRANLRKESGAAIGVDEARQEIRNYFPMPGDTPETIAQKARNRQVTERAMRQAAGGAMAPPQAQRQESSGGQPVRIQSAEDYNRLPTGTLYIAPDGTQRRKR